AGRAGGIQGRGNSMIFDGSILVDSIFAGSAFAGFETGAEAESKATDSRSEEAIGDAAFMAATTSCVGVLFSAGVLWSGSLGSNFKASEGYRGARVCRRARKRFTRAATSLRQASGSGASSRSVAIGARLSTDAACISAGSISGVFGTASGSNRNFMVDECGQR